MRVLPRMIRLLRPFTGQIATATAFGVATVVCGIGLMGTAAFLITTAALRPSIADLQVAIVGVRFFGLFRGVFRYLERVSAHHLTLNLLTRLRIWFCEALEPLAPARTFELRSADLLARAGSDVETLQEFYVRVLAAPLIAAVIAVGTSVFLGTFSPRFALAFAASYSIAAVAVPVGVGRLGRPIGSRLSALRANLGAMAVDGLQGMAELLVFSESQTHSRRFRELSRTLARERERAARVEALGSAAVTFITHATVWCLLFLAIPLVRNGVIDGVSLAVVCLVAMAAFEAAHALPAIAQHLEEQASAARRVFAILDARPSVREPETPVPLNAEITKPDLKAEGVEFSYPGSRRAALSGFNLELRAGRRIAIVGPSGAGKSTFAHLLLRFWDPTIGVIRVAGHPLPDYRLDELRAFVGVLEQRTDLFTGTVRDNFKVARPNASHEELEEAARRTDLLTTIRNLPEGWNTWIGERGLLLSGGQRRRLAVARLVLRDPPLLVLDEPTAGLDPVTSRRIMRSLRALMRGRSTVLISHRLINMDDMNEIVVLDQGRVVERGTHKTLLRERGLYWQLYDAQLLELGEDSKHEL